MASFFGLIGLFPVSSWSRSIYGSKKCVPNAHLLLQSPSKVTQKCQNIAENFANPLGKACTRFVPFELRCECDTLLSLANINGWDYVRHVLTRWIANPMENLQLVKMVFFHFVCSFAFPPPLPSLSIPSVFFACKNINTLNGVRQCDFVSRNNDERRKKKERKMEYHRLKRVCKRKYQFSSCERWREEKERQRWTMKNCLPAIPPPAYKCNHGSK